LEKLDRRQHITMAEAPQVALADGIEVSDKPALHSSTSDVSKTKYSLDGVDDGEPGDDIYDQANPPRPGFTRSDQKDMWRMGKVQEFKVRYIALEEISAFCLLNIANHSNLQRNYRPLSALSFATVLSAVWEYLLM
jgi:hypothetical protein